VIEGRFHLRLASVLLIVTAVLAAIPAVDMGFSRAFYAEGRWLWRGMWLWRFLFHYGCVPALIMVFAATLVWAASHLTRRWHACRRPCLIMALTVLLGPGLLVNVLIKPYWGRPRPLHVQAFGGQQPYRAWWQPSDHLTTDRGFASGHAATGFSLLAAALVLPPPWRRTRALATAAALSFGSLMALGRIAEGKHFLADVALSAAVTYWILAVLLVFPFDRLARWASSRYDHLRPPCPHHASTVEAEAA